VQHSLQHGATQLTTRCNTAYNTVQHSLQHGATRPSGTRAAAQPLGADRPTAVADCGPLPPTDGWMDGWMDRAAAGGTACAHGRSIGGGWRACESSDGPCATGAGAGAGAGGADVSLVARADLRRAVLLDHVRHLEHLDRQRRRLQRLWPSLSRSLRPIRLRYGTVPALTAVSEVSFRRLPQPFQGARVCTLPGLAWPGLAWPGLAAVRAHPTAAAQRPLQTLRVRQPRAGGLSASV
jgi:hypothetical protein